ncbi:class I SAM-dependent methyltransferase [Halostella sp. PRR32]|uniref:class I SAM-dependent methyltransferase n=1 Tax=Halostella sp. PRR32 TaxID=3098147 RepID=UPI002B1E137A|nr:class I SAM-dependent methyltransferase [Halostella sp. PRR32]
MDRRPVDVRDTYDRIAGHFAETREYPWPEVESFVEDAPRSEVALDLGCGNGRHAELLAAHTDRVLACDISRGLLATARSRLSERNIDADLLQGDAGAVPLADDSVGLAVYVATLHHLPTGDARLASLDELARVLSTGAPGLVSAWSTAHDRFDAGEGFDTTVDWTLPGGETVPRFYHVYSPDEFESDLAESDLGVRSAFVSSGNCYAVVEGA